MPIVEMYLSIPILMWNHPVLLLLPALGFLISRVINHRLELKERQEGVQEWPAYIHYEDPYNLYINKANNPEDY